jgi:hypothetical protein
MPYTRYVNNTDLKSPAPFTGVTITETATGYNIHRLTTTHQNALYGRKPLHESSFDYPVDGWGAMSADERIARIDSVFTAIRRSIRED